MARDNGLKGGSRRRLVHGPAGGEVTFKEHYRDRKR
jgi:hypothetical protein